MNSLRAKIVSTTVCASVLILAMGLGTTGVRASIVGIDACMQQEMPVHPDGAASENFAIQKSLIQSGLRDLRGSYRFSCCVGMDMPIHSVDRITIENALNLEVGFLKLPHRRPVPVPVPVSVPTPDSSRRESTNPITPTPVE